MRYKKKPVEINAVEWTGQNHREMFIFLSGGETPTPEYLNGEGNNFYISHGKCVGGLVIKTLEGEHIATIGDYIIKGVKGEFYPCKPVIFKLTYDEIK